MLPQPFTSYVDNTTITESHSGSFEKFLSQTLKAWQFKSLSIYPSCGNTYLILT